MHDLVDIAYELSSPLRDYIVVFFSPFCSAEWLCFGAPLRRSPLPTYLNSINPDAAWLALPVNATHKHDRSSDDPEDFQRLAPLGWLLSSA